MSVNLVVNGIPYPYPQTGEENWGDPATNWAIAITSGMLQKSGGLFTLTSEVDFGANYGIKSLYFKSRTANIATAGQIRLANADVISWRNSANSANRDLKPKGDGSGILTYGGLDLVDVSSAQSLSNKTLVSPIITGSATFVDLSTTGNTIIGDADTDTLSINADLITSIIPDVTNTYDLGTSSKRWRNLYLSGDLHVANQIIKDAAAGTITEDFLQSATLSDNQASAAVVTTYTAASSNHFIVEYSILRGSIRETGILMIVHDGTNAYVTPVTVASGLSGIDFTADISGANLRLLYTSTATGNSATMKFAARRWAS